MTSAFLEAPVLRGDHVVLEPLAPEHEAELHHLGGIRGSRQRLGREARDPCAVGGGDEG